MIIGLLGFEFESPNKGCEALSYSFLSYLQSEFSGEDLVVYNFSNKGLGYVQNEFPMLKFKHIRLKIKDFSFVMIRAFAECDYVFDVTMGDSFSDIYSKQCCINNMKFKRIAELFAKQYILLPQTYGPYNDAEVLKKAINILKRASMIYCRDEMSQKYLKKICGIDNSFLTTDLAFMLPFDEKLFSADKDVFNLGINVSGLLWKGGFSSNNQFGLSVEYAEYIKALLQHYLECNNIKIHLIPHVINMNENPHDDDYFICALLKKQFQQICVAPAFRTPMEAKSYIANMDCFVGARMHSTIAAFSARVPTIPFSYSRKFEGLFDSLEYKYVIHGSTDTLDECLRRTIEYISRAEELSSVIEDRMLLIDKKIDYFRSSLRKECLRHE